jgi:hypothetical protein
MGCSRTFFSRFSNGHLIALEADPGNFKMLARNTTGFSDRVTLVQAAVWNKNTRLVFSEAAALAPEPNRFSRF